jgi:hypothetical protein
MRSPFPPEDKIMEKGPDNKAAPPNLVILSNVRPETAPAKSQSLCARQRLEDQFRQRFLEQHPRGELATVLDIGAEPATTVNGRTS